MFGFVYVWTNLIDGKKYVGSHEGLIEDGYIGSGKYFNNAINKHGIENFIREILEAGEFESRNALFDREQFWLDSFNAARDPNWYNIAEIAGGGGDTRIGWSEERLDEFKNQIAAIWADRTDDEIKEIVQKRLATIDNDPNWKERVGDKMRETYAKKGKDFLLARAQKTLEKYGPEKRSAAVKMGKEKMGPEKRKEAARKAAANTTPDVRAEAARKAVKTKKDKPLEEKLATAELKRKAMTGKLSGAKNGRAKQVCAAGKVYNTLKEAMAGVGISEPTLYKRIKSNNFNDYYYIDKEQK